MRHDATSIPNKRVSSAVTSAGAQTLIAVNDPDTAVVGGYLYSIAAAADTCQFQSVDGTIVYATLSVTSRGTTPIQPFQVAPSKGLAVLGLLGTVNSRLTIFLWHPGSAGLGVAGAS